MKYWPIVLLALLPASIFSQKRVLLEKYTSAYCGACPNGHLAANGLQEIYPELILAFHHSSVDGMANPYSTEWKDDFMLPGTPMGMVDRKGEVWGQLFLAPSEWESAIQQQLQEPAYVDIGLEGHYDPYTRELSLDVVATFLEAPPAGELRLNLMVLEDTVIQAGGGFDQSNYDNETEGHPLQGRGNPIYFYPHQHVVRAVLDSTWGTPGAFPEEPVMGQAYQHHYDYYITYRWAHERVRLVAFVSLYHEQDRTRRTILNATELPLFELQPATATQEASQPARLMAYPNPAGAGLWVSLPNGCRRVELLSAAGRAILSYAPDSNPFYLDTASLPRGIYLLRAQYPEGVITQLVGH